MVCPRVVLSQEWCVPAWSPLPAWSPPQEWCVSAWSPRVVLSPRGHPKEARSQIFSPCALATLREPIAAVSEFFLPAKIGYSRLKLISLSGMSPVRPLPVRPLRSEFPRSALSSRMASAGIAESISFHRPSRWDSRATQNSVFAHVKRIKWSVPKRSMSNK